MSATVFLMCHNERLMIARTCDHYRRLLPGCEIVVCDNESSDGSAQIARDLGCRVRSFATGDTFDELVMLGVRNNVWKEAKSGWIVMCDMDEYLCVSARELAEEAAKGVTMLTTRGFEIVGASASPELDDIDLARLDRGYPSEWYSKRACFRREAIAEMNYSVGCHQCRPAGRVVYSEAEYPLYHMNYLGLPYLVAKHRQRFARSHAMRQRGMLIHYSANPDEVAAKYQRVRVKCSTVPTLASVYARAAS